METMCKSRMNPRDQLPTVMREATHAGYLVIWNKHYDQLEPHLMGKGNELDEVMKNLLRRSPRGPRCAVVRSRFSGVERIREGGVGLWTALA